MSAAERIRPFGHSLAIVMFGSSTIGYLQCLKKGYQHCFVATQDQGTWLLLDPLSNGTTNNILGPARVEDILNAFKGDGYDAVVVQRQAPVLKEMPWAPYTCVEAVKRILGIQSRWVLTPWQLRQYITERENA